MNVSLNPHFDAFIQSQIDSGRYHSASEVVREALRLLEERQHLYERKLEALKRDIQEGLDSFEQHGGIDGEEFFAQLEADLGEIKK
jgi:antitoxin ParD1/3/4